MIGEVVVDCVGENEIFIGEVLYEGGGVEMVGVVVGEVGFVEYEEVGDVGY